MALPLERQSPRVAGSENRMRLGGRAHSTISADPVELVLSRLDRVRKCGNGFIARCPAHEDRSASLSVATGNDGRALTHCFAGCSAADVVAAIGLQLADLYPERIAPQTPDARQERREFAQMANWRAALNVLNFEALLIESASQYLIHTGPLTQQDHERLILASQRVTDAKAVLDGR
jgi:hypothetical protein